MEGENLNAINHVKNISKKQGTFAIINSIMKKAHENQTQNKLEDVIDNMVNKTIIEYHQRNKCYTVPDFTGDTVLLEQTQETDKDATQAHSQDNENLIKKKQLQDKRYEVTDKDITETCDIATKTLFEEL